MAGLKLYRRVVSEVDNLKGARMFAYQWLGNHDDAIEWVNKVCLAYDSANPEDIAFFGDEVVVTSTTITYAGNKGCWIVFEAGTFRLLPDECFTKRWKEVASVDDKAFHGGGTKVGGLYSGMMSEAFYCEKDDMMSIPNSIYNSVVDYLRSKL